MEALWGDCFPGPLAKWPYWEILQLSPHIAMLFSPFGCIYQPNSPCPTLSAPTEPISQGHCWKWHHKLFDTYKSTRSSPCLKTGWTHRSRHSKCIDNTILTHSIIHSDIFIFVMETYLSLFKWFINWQHNAYTDSLILIQWCRVIISFRC